LISLLKKVGTDSLQQNYFFAGIKHVVYCWDKCLIWFWKERVCPLLLAVLASCVDVINADVLTLG